MNIRYIAAGLVFCLGLGTLSAKELKVLMIGNSFSNSVGVYLPKIVKASGHKLELASANFGGCSLKQHSGNLIAVEKNPSYRPCRIDEPRYKPHPNPKFDYDQTGMYERVRDLCRALAAEYKMRVIPVGTAVQCFRKNFPVKFQIPSEASVYPDIPPWKGDAVGITQWVKNQTKRKDRTAFGLYPSESIRKIHSDLCLVLVSLWRAGLENYLAAEGFQTGGMCSAEKMCTGCTGSLPAGENDHGAWPGLGSFQKKV